MNRTVISRSNIGCPPDGSRSFNFSTYAPVRDKCSQTQQWIRPADSISPEGATWVHGRRLKVLNGLDGYLGNLHLECFDSEEYLRRLRQNPDNIPNLAYAISGGAWTSAMMGTGPLHAFDGRFAPAVEQRVMTRLAGRLLHTHHVQYW